MITIKGAVFRNVFRNDIFLEWYRVIRFFWACNKESDHGRIFSNDIFLDMQLEREKCVKEH